MAKDKLRGVSGKIKRLGSKNSKNSKHLSKDSWNSDRNYSSPQTKMQTQHEGYLNIYKREQDNHWKKRYCIIKDGFFLYYLSNSNGMFDKKPRGIIPLNGAFIGKVEEDMDQCTLELIHKDIVALNFHLKAESLLEANDWLQALRRGKKATLENARLGARLLNEAEMKKSKVQNKKIVVTESIKEHGEKLSKLEKDKNRIEERKQKDMKRMEEKMSKVTDAHDEKLEERDTIREEIEAQELKLDWLKQEQLWLQSKIDFAHKHLALLEGRTE